LFSTSGSSELDRLFQTKMPRLGAGTLIMTCGGREGLELYPSPYLFSIC
jgi:hypothetical protein